jgi:hypothetical protein
VFGVSSNRAQGFREAITMSGRHRRTQVTGARRALAGTVPVLGLAGVVTAGVGSAGDSVPEASGSTLVTTPIPAPAPVALEQQDLGIGPDITTVASDAARAAGQAGEQQREQERRSIDALVADVRGDAQAREAAAAQQGQQQLVAFQREVEKQKQKDRQDVDRSHEAPGHDDGYDDRYEGSCTPSGWPRMGGSEHSDEIVGRDCGLVDLMGMQRSSDSWIDGQLLASREDG